MTHPLDVADLRGRVQACLDDELRTQRAVLVDLGPDVEVMVDGVQRLLSGGKRLRAGFLWWGYRAAGGPDSPALVRLASAMEMFQAAALIHDDVMDDSDTRRGMPAAHRALAGLHRRQGWDGDPDRFGAAGAILAGNLCLTWADELYATCGLPEAELARARGLFDRMRTQLMAGQFLDVAESVRDWRSLPEDQRVARARHVITYKSAKYSIEHPLLIGALAGGANQDVVAALSRYGVALGRAFQLRDDLLGVFGDPAVTGKPAGDDLREGKRTVLVAHTLAGADESGRELVWSLLGRPDLGTQDVERLRAVIRSSGGERAVEDEIGALTAQARNALDEAHEDITGEAYAALGRLVDLTTERTT